MTTVNKKIKTLSIILLIMISVSLQKTVAQINSFYVYFKQNDKRVNIKDAKVELKNQPFQIFIEYTEPLDLFVSASYKSGTYNQAKAGKLMFQMPAFYETKNLESFFMNPGTINLFTDKSMIWEKGKTDGEKMIKTEAGRFLAYRNIEKLYSTEHSNLQNLNDVQYDLNLIFIFAENDEDGDFQEFQRELVKVKWVKSYDEDTKSFERQNTLKDKQRKAQIEHNKKSKEKLENKEEQRLKKIEEHKLKGKTKDEKSLDKEAEKKKKKEEKKQNKED